MEHCDILSIGQAENFSGFNRVFTSIYERIYKYFKIVHFGINYRGKRINEKWILEPNQVGGDILGIEQLEGLILKYNPKVIFFCHDYWLYHYHRPILKKYKLIDKVVFYCPIEYATSDDGRINLLSEIPTLVCYTQYGFDTLLNEAKLSNTKPFITLQKNIIPHGIDTNTFYPLDESIVQIRRELFPNRPELWDATIVLNANKNNQRKRLDLTLISFAKFIEKQKCQDCYLYLHSLPIDNGIYVERYIKELNLEPYVIYPLNNDIGLNVDDTLLNKIYNACDIGLNTCVGEGWGLIAFEHGATGKCQILPAHTACHELWQNSAYMIPVNDSFEVDTDILSEVLHLLYTDKTLRSKYDKLAYNNATNPCFRWDNIVVDWRNIFSRYTTQK